MLALVTFFQQSKRSTQRIRRRPALVAGHAVDFELKSKVFRAGLFSILIQPDRRIRCDRLCNTFDLHVPALFAAHVVLHKRVGLE